MITTKNDGTVRLSKVLTAAHSGATRHWTGELRQPGVENGEMRFVKLNEDDNQISRTLIGKPGTPPHARETFAVVHEKGHGYWSGRGQPQAYQAAQLHVVRIIQKMDEFDVVVLPLFSFPAKAVRFTPVR